MRVTQNLWMSGQGWRDRWEDGAELPPGRSFILAMGDGEVWEDRTWREELRGLFPEVSLVGCSAAGEIEGEALREGVVAVTALSFDATTVRVISTSLEALEGSFRAGHFLGRALEAPHLRHVLVLTDGITVQGADFAQGLSEALPEGVRASGGMAGDGARSQCTTLLEGDILAPGRALALGFYGPSLGVGCGVFGGWSPFGPPRTVSRSQGAFLAELDGRNALDLLRQYVGDEVLDDERLMSFPLGVCDDQGKVVAVRALFRADLHGRRVVTVGEIPEGTRVRFLRGSAESVLDGAREAARASLESLGRAPEWALAVGCYGRKCFLGPRAEEEILEVAGALGGSVPLAGFLSYGELAPVSGMGRGCLFHNETMTVTAFAED